MSTMRKSDVVRQIAKASGIELIDLPLARPTTDRSNTMSKSNPVDKVVSNSNPLELSAELTKFAITNASKDPSTLEAAVFITAHNFVDEDGDDALNFAAAVGGNPNHVADLLIEAMTTLVDTRPLLAIKFHEALVEIIRDKAKAVRSRAKTKDIDKALENVLASLANFRDSIKK